VAKVEITPKAATGKGGGGWGGGCGGGGGGGGFWVCWGGFLIKLG